MSATITLAALRAANLDRLQAELHAALAETRKLREALGLAHYAPPRAPRNMDAGHAH